MTTLKILQGDNRQLIKKVPDASVQCIVTSPPYWGLRSYLPKGHPQKHLEIGQEKTPQEYVRVMVELMREARRTLKDDGTLWLNLGDSFNHKSSGGHGATGGRDKSTLASKLPPINTTPTKKQFVSELKEKDLVGIPWRVAFALQEDGWYLRSDIIWHKPNPMPESVRDRPTRSHEYIFLFSKSEKYFYDSEAIRERPSPELIKQIQDGYNGSAIKDYIGASVQDASAVKSRIITGHRNRIDKQRGHSRRHAGFNDKWDALTPAEQAMCGCNKRDVWTVAPANYKEAHFATFPPKLIEPCILAGSRKGDTVMDLFGGSGVTARVAFQWNRNAIIFELNDEYIPLIKKLGLLFNPNSFKIMTLAEWKKVRGEDWKTEPISCTCEVLTSTKPTTFCDKPTAKAYPTMGGGWMALCARHGLRHKEAFKIDDLISDGEKFK